MLTRAAWVAALLVLLGLLLAPSANAGPVTCELRNVRTGACLIEIELPPQVAPISDPQPGQGDAGAVPTCQNTRGDQIPCTDPELGSWSGSRGCYVAPADPQPPPGDPIWEGNEGGAIYRCYVPPGFLPGTGFGISNLFWSGAPPDAVVLTPGQAAEIVVVGMDLRAIDIGIVPEAGAGSVGLVGLPVWMWSEETANTWGPLSRTADRGRRQHHGGGQGAARRLADGRRRHRHMHDCRHRVRGPLPGLDVTGLRAQVHPGVGRPPRQRLRSLGDELLAG